MSDHSVMKGNPSTHNIQHQGTLTLDELNAVITAQYNAALANGFVGTIEEYCKLRDYTQPSN